MRRKTLFCTIIIMFLMCLAQASHAQMQSANYSITTSVLSGGGAPMGSANYETSATLGQPSPLMDPADPPGSTNYGLYPGFWYTVDAAAVIECDYCFQDTKGYTWCMNKIGQNAVGLYLEGTCDTGTPPLKEAKGLYNWSSHLVMKAEGGADGILFQYHMRWGQTGLWIDDTGAYGPIDVSQITCGASSASGPLMGDGLETASSQDAISESDKSKILEGLADADYCLEDSAGYIWDLDKLAQDAKGIYFIGTCDTGSEVIDVIGSYTWARAGLALTAFDGSIPNLTCSYRWGRTGQWIDVSGSAGTGDMGFCAAGQ